MTTYSKPKFRPPIPESWKPSAEGEILEGVILLVDSITVSRPDRMDVVPRLEIVSETGEVRSVLMGCASLRKIMETESPVEDGYIGLKYEGLSQTIEKQGNYMKQYGYFYYAPDTWDYNEEGEVIQVTCLSPDRTDKPALQRQAEHMESKIPEPGDELIRAEEEKMSRREKAGTRSKKK